MKRKGHVAASKMLMLGVLCLATVGAARTASAATYRSPFGEGVPVTAVAAYSPDNGGNYIFWNKNSTGECRTTFLGQGTLSTSGTIYAPNNAASSSITISDATVAYTCGGVAVWSLRYGGYYLDMVGGAGNDSLVAWGWGDTFVHGQGGDDTIVAQRPGATVSGGTGKDDVTAWNHTSVSYYDLGDGNDCLIVGNISPPPPNNRILCGAGTDTLLGTFNSGTNCEVWTTNTCWPFATPR